MPPMPVQNFPDNILYELDNLDVLRGMNSETIDLIATDPLFNTRRNRRASTDADGSASTGEPTPDTTSFAVWRA